MPEATGLQFAEALKHLKFPPLVVFVTAYSEHAADAFEVNAIDYLQKPVETERLAKAVQRVRDQVALQAQAQRNERISVEKAERRSLSESIPFDLLKLVTITHISKPIQTGIFQRLAWLNWKSALKATVSSVCIVPILLTFQWLRKLNQSKAARCL